MTDKFFISYARADGEFALKLVQRLRADGIELWIDQLEIPTGTPWDRSIEVALKEAPGLLVVLTPASVASENVLDEVSYGLDYGKRIVPLLLTDCEVPLRLRRLQRVDFRGGFDAAFQRSLADLRSLLFAKRLGEAIDKIYGAGMGQNTNVSNLSLVDANTKSVMLGRDAEFINGAVEEGMKALAAQNPRYVISNSLPNDDANAQKLSAIFWNGTMSRTEKVDAIVRDLMAPGNIDGLVTGQFSVEKPDGSANRWRLAARLARFYMFRQKPEGAVLLRLFVISRASRNMIVESLRFTQQEFFSRGPNNSTEKMIGLCAIVGDIRDTVVRLIKQI